MSLPDGVGYDSSSDVVYNFSGSQSLTVTNNGDGTYKVTEYCTMCDQSGMNGISSMNNHWSGPFLNAMMHHFGLHENHILRDTIYAESGSTDTGSIPDDTGSGSSGN